MSDLILALALMSVGWGVVSSIAIVSFLSSRGVKINFFLLRVMILKYVNDYHRITKEETGVPGPWYYSYIISMFLALVFAIAGLVLRRI